MIGAVIGDIVGSVYEFHNNKGVTHFPLFTKKNRFTDDTVLTIAMADSIMTNRNYAEMMKEYYFKYPNVGYGGNFHRWAQFLSKPYNSWGNGSAMRTSPVAWAYDDLKTVLKMAEKNASYTHNHPEGIKGARATCHAIFLARTGVSKEMIKSIIEETYNYNLDFSYTELVKKYKFDVSCMGTVPQAIFMFLYSEGFEDCIRKTVSIGGDTDTLCAIAGSIAEAYYGVPDNIVAQAKKFLPYGFIDIITDFRSKYVLKTNVLDD